MIRSGFIGGWLGYSMLKVMGRHAMAPDYQSATSYHNRSKLESLLGQEVWNQLRGNVVIDYGCGGGATILETLEHGASYAIGIDTSPRVLAKAEANARNAGVSHLCKFVGTSDKPAESIQQADVILSIDAFEHYDNPDQILTQMRNLLKPGGRVLICFGPPWLHPYGGHLFSIFPWSHLLFTEESQIRWRSDFKSDGAQRFHQVEGGLNQMTIRRFRHLIDHSDFTIEKFEPVPIRKLRWLNSQRTSEFTTSVIRCTLVLRDEVLGEEAPREEVKQYEA